MSKQTKRPRRPDELNGEHGHIYDLILYGLERHDALAKEVRSMYKAVIAVGATLLVALGGLYYGLLEMLGG